MMPFGLPNANAFTGMPFGGNTGGSSNNGVGFNVDDLVKRIDAKIAQLEEEEKRESENKIDVSSFNLSDLAKPMDNGSVTNDNKDVDSNSNDTEGTDSNFTDSMYDEKTDDDQFFDDFFADE